jgi:hypothetical protein
MAGKGTSIMTSTNSTNMGMAPCADGLGNRAVSKPNIFMRIGLLPDQKMEKSPKNGIKSVSTNLYLVISAPIDTKYTVVQGKKQQKWQKLPHF